MLIAHPANVRALVLNGNKLHEYIALEINDEVSVTEDDTFVANDIQISLGGVIFGKIFNTTRVEVEEIRFVLIDPTIDHIKSQVVGVAESNPFDESQPGEVHLLD